MSTEAPSEEHLVLRETPCLACLAYLSSFTPRDGEPVSCCDDVSKSESQVKDTSNEGRCCTRCAFLNKACVVPKLEHTKQAVRGFMSAFNENPRNWTSVKNKQYLARAVLEAEVDRHSRPGTSNKGYSESLDCIIPELSRAVRIATALGQSEIPYAVDGDEADERNMEWSGDINYALRKVAALVEKVDKAYLGPAGSCAKECGLL